jgi:hypothetical protein
MWRRRIAGFIKATDLAATDVAATDVAATDCRSTSNWNFFIYY